MKMLKWAIKQSRPSDVPQSSSHRRVDTVFELQVGAISGEFVYISANYLILLPLGNFIILLPCISARIYLLLRETGTKPL